MANQNDPKNKNLGKFLSYILRHKPMAIGLEMDDRGWVSVEALIQKINSTRKHGINLDILTAIVKSDNKQRYSFNADKTMIRANQGHSVLVDLGYEKSIPPEYLYHGTAVINLDSIKQKGLLRRSRHHVHLSLDKKTAVAVGKRHGKPVVLTIKSGKMQRDGIAFYCSENNVWLTETVAPQYIEFPKSIL
ncbi:MAG: RNA 2'-phosphotransferase [Spirochaetota bacterium]